MQENNQTFNSYYLEMTLNTKTSGELLKYVGKLEEENKKLKENISWYEKEEDRLREENQKLKKELEIRLNANRILRMHDAKMEYDNKKLKEERDKWRGKYNRLKSEFNLLKNKIGTTQK